MHEQQNENDKPESLSFEPETITDLTPEDDGSAQVIGGRPPVPPASAGKNHNELAAVDDGQ
jgi:hypothetical protein